MNQESEKLNCPKLHKELTKKLQKYTGRTDVSDIVQEAYCKTLEWIEKNPDEEIKSPINQLFITCRNIWINEGKKRKWRSESDYIIHQRVYDWAFKKPGDPELIDHVEIFIESIDTTKFPLLKEWMREYLSGVDTRRIALSYYRKGGKLIRKSEEEILRICNSENKGDLDSLFELPNAYPHANVSFPVTKEMKRLREYLSKVYEEIDND